nr:MAG TPA: hypothetical protein [Caudoviricetes sp.]
MLFHLGGEEVLSSSEIVPNRKSINSSFFCIPHFCYVFHFIKILWGRWLSIIHTLCCSFCCNLCCNFFLYIECQILHWRVSIFAFAIVRFIIRHSKFLYSRMQILRMLRVLIRFSIQLDTQGIEQVSIYHIFCSMIQSFV